MSNNNRRGMSGGHHGDAADSLTEREKEILALWTDGKSDKEVAVKLDVSVETIKSHAKHIFLKLQVHNRVEACRKLWRSERKGPRPNG
ncbi:MAG: helix-turn-helix transcriptional regulator [Verrucomicrobiales bacterium]|nr:helix-turn-helix transcriptional regulator [Verrucomicrobiales bacterium]